MPADPRPAYERLARKGAGGGILAGLVTGIDHIGVCVAGIDDAAAGWSALLGLPLVDREDVAAQRTAAGFVRLPDGGAALELVCPMPGNTGLDKFVVQRGDALHHVAFAVSDIAEALERLTAAGVDLHRPRGPPGSRRTSGCLPAPARARRHAGGAGAARRA